MTRNNFKKIAFVSSNTEEADKAAQRLIARYGQVESESADVIVALGGDGLMLSTAHAHMNSGIPIYGMNRGSVGFLMNEYQEENLLERLRAAEVTEIHPLGATTISIDNQQHQARAINEVSLLRQTHQTAKIRISIDGKVRMEELICDGLLVSTPAGSTAYNLSAHGPILPINSPLLALTTISPFRPRRWRGALLSNEVQITIEILEPKKRPVSATADHVEFRNIARVEIAEDREASNLMLFDDGHNLDERILREQFLY
ncbi:MAG: NAD kinase [Fimbriimonadaceae bacterium]|nr:NAD kinase [Alphaproteobacteria bacterium]